MKAKQIILFTTFSTIMYASTSPMVFKENDTVNIDTCDKFFWCKISNEDKYIKKFNFINISKNTYKKKAFIDAFTYSKTTDNLKVLNLAVSKQELEKMKVTGYVKDIDVYNYNANLAAKNSISTKENAQKLAQELIIKNDELNLQNTNTVKKSINTQINKNNQLDTQKQKIQKSFTYKNLLLAAKEDKVKNYNNFIQMTFNNSNELSSLSYDIAVGRYFTKNYSLSFDYEKFDFTAHNANSYNLNFAYRFNTFLHPHIAIAVGKSNINNPKLTSSDVLINKNTYGINTAINYKFNKKIFFVLKATYKKHTKEDEDFTISTVGFGFKHLF